MRTTKEIGDFYEKYAADYYTQNGFKIIERNFRYKKGEIDLIAKKTNLICFIEVKYRNTNTYGYSEEMVSEEQQERILTCAEEYIIRNNIDDNIRFDIISINKDKKIELFEDAFG